MRMSDTIWKLIKIDDLFNVITGANLDKSLLEDGLIPRVTARDTRNGVDGFFEPINNRNYREFSNIITVSFLGSVSYQPYRVSLDMKIHGLVRKDGLNFEKNSALFLCGLLRREFSKYTYGNQLSSSDLVKTKILFPVNERGQLNWDFMENYVRDKVSSKNYFYDEFVRSKYLKIKYKKILSLNEKNWQKFFIQDLFHIKPGKRLVKEKMIIGEMPFIGSTDSNNGITSFVSNMNSSCDSNVLGVNYNGSVGELFYHPYKCIFSDDVKRFSLKSYNGNMFVYLFFKVIIMKQKSKYNYGYKFNSYRMNRQLIMVPVNTLNEPDYEYMEQYIKNSIIKNIKNYFKGDIAHYPNSI